MTPASQPDARPPGKPPRSALTVRDLLGALAVLVAVVLVVGGLTRGCSVAPGGPRADPAAAPRVDAAAALRPLAAAAPFPVRLPAVPAGWTCTTVDTARTRGGALLVRAGYLSPAGRYLRVVQTDAAEEDLLAGEAEGVPVAGGALDVGGVTWVTYADRTPEPIRVAEVGSPAVRMLITGSGTEEEFRTLAAAATGGDVLPR